MGGHDGTHVQRGGGGISWENFVCKEGGEIFPWRNLGYLAVQCVPEAVYALGFATGAKISPSEISPGEKVPA